MYWYTNNELSEKYVNKMILFAIASKTIKHLGINLLRRWNIYALKNKILIKEDTNKWNLSHVHDLEELRSLKCQY